MPQRNLLFLIATATVSCICFLQGQQGPYAKYVSLGLTTIERHALDPAPSAKLFAGAMQGMVRVLAKSGDQHSQFFDEVAARQLRTEIQQQTGGIGVRIHVTGQPPRITIHGPIQAKSPAAVANLRPGDEILKIDGEAITLPNAESVLNRLNGPPGSIVRVHVWSSQENRDRTVAIMRELIPVEAVLGDRRDIDGSWHFALASEPRIAHVRITTFGDRTTEQFASTLHQLASAGVKAVVLDMRDNSGGSFAAAVGVSELLLPAGATIAETRGRDDRLRQRYATQQDGAYCQLPVAVIVNQNSASAAEIVAASLQDHHRAIVVGQRTFGKGTVQQMLPLGKGLLKLTWAGFRRPNGDPIHRTSRARPGDTWGVLPDDGFECVLSPQRWLAYREYRSRRDEADGLAHTMDQNFLDEPLELAVTHLKGVLSQPAFPESEAL